MNNKKEDTQRVSSLIFGTPKGTRTPDLLIRSQSLYPTELSAHVAFLKRLDILARHTPNVKYYFQIIATFFAILLDIL